MLEASRDSWRAQHVVGVVYAVVYAQPSDSHQHGDWRDMTHTVGSALCEIPDEPSFPEPRTRVRVMSLHEGGSVANCGACRFAEEPHRSVGGGAPAPYSVIHTRGEAIQMFQCRVWTAT